MFLIFANFHHIIFDGFSINILVHELKMFYESTQIDALPCQYSEYAEWQNSSLKDIEIKKLWWTERLKDAPLILSLPCDKARPNISTHQGALYRFHITKLPEIKQLASSCQTSLFTLLLSIFHVLIYKYSAQNDFVIGIPTSGRTNAKFNETIGSFVNTLPIRTTSNSYDEFTSLLRTLKMEMNAALENQDVPFEKIIENLKFDRLPSHSPIFQIMFNMIPKIETSEIAHSKINVLDVDRGMSHFDLSLNIEENSEGLFGVFEFNTDLFYQETIAQMANHFCNITHEILNEPQRKISDISMLDSNELSQLTECCNQCNVPYKHDLSIIQSFEKQVESSPNAIALICDEKSYSFAQLNTQANLVAHSLLELGLKPEQKVVVFLERSAEFIPAIFGVLKAGGVYIPIDPSQPKERLNTILDELLPFCILTMSHLKTNSKHLTIHIDSLPSEKTENPSIAISQNNSPISSTPQARQVNPKA